MKVSILLATIQYRLPYVYSIVALCESGTVRLVSEGSSYFRRYGRVEICINQAWNTICDLHWDNNDASVVCRQLGFSPYGTIDL